MKFIKIIQANLESDIKKFLESNEAQDVLSKANGDDKEYTIKFKITNESTDRDGEIIKADGIDWKHFDKNPVILIDHRYTVNSIAGKALKRETKGKDTFLTVQLAKGVPAGELVKTLNDQKMIKGVSIGFIPLERDANNSAIITKSEALEASFVAIGSNREALIEDQKLYKKCVELGMIKEAKEEHDDEEDKKKGKEDEIDLKMVLDKINEVKEDINALRNEIKSSKTVANISDDKEEEAKEKTRKAGQDLAKHLSLFLGQAKQSK